jgi:hypothetical protein
MLTRAMRLENGRPPSRAKAQSIREAVVRIPTQANNWVMSIMQIWVWSLSVNESDHDPFIASLRSWTRISIDSASSNKPIIRLTIAVAPEFDPTA